jgi:hypothetical protein
MFSIIRADIVVNVFAMLIACMMLSAFLCLGFAPIVSVWIMLTVIMFFIFGIMALLFVNA